TFYTFTWAPKPRFQRPERPARPERAPRIEATPRPEGAPRPEGEKREGGRRNRNSNGGKPNPKPLPVADQGDGKPYGRAAAQDAARAERLAAQAQSKGGKPHRKGGAKDHDRPKSYDARPPRADRPVDPDNPFAVLAALKAKL
ncbi:MAG: hypothetical protein V4516_13180, partial [Pseudomonadota bacterium]